VALTTFACSSCWRALPREIRTRINDAWRARDWRGHAVAKRDAAAFYASREVDKPSD
jgi:hypothetical protein